MAVVDDSKEKTARIAVKVSPNALNNEVRGLRDGVLQVRVAAPPERGKANRELAIFLAHLLEISRRDIDIVRGVTSREKLIEVHDLDREEVLRRLGWEK